jgi:L-2-hydroxyglutarate oxidase LhgO
MKKIVVLSTLILFSLDLFADTKLTLHSKFIPKILKQDLDFKEKHKANILNSAIIYTNESKSLAKELQKKLFLSISKNYKNLNSINIDLLSDQYIDNISKYSFIYSFGKDNLEKIYQQAQKNGVVTFCYNEKELINGCAIHIREIKNVEILYNKNVINDTGIIFSKSFLKVVKSYD